MESISQVINIETLLVIIFDGLNGRQLVLVDPAYKFPRFLFLISDFLNFGVEERSLHRFDCALETFPIFQISCHSIIVQCTSTLFIPPTLGMLCDVDLFWIHSPYIFDFWCERIGSFFKFDRIRYVWNVNTPDSVFDFLDEANFFFTVFCNGIPEWVDIFLINSNWYCKRSMIWGEMLIWVDRMVVKFSWTTLQEH